MNKLAKGLFLGGLVGAGAMWLNMTETGESVRKELVRHLKKIRSLTNQKVQESDTYQDLSEEEFRKILIQVADKYANEEDLSETTKKLLVRVINKHWDGVKADIKEKE